MKIIITERQLALISEQSNKPLKVSINDAKFDEIYNKYCGTRKLSMPKEIVEKQIPILKKEISDSVLRKIEEEKEDSGGNSHIVNTLVNGSLDGVIPFLQTIAVNSLYAQTGLISSYDQSNDVLNLSNKIFNNLNSQMKSSYKLMASLYVNKKNVGSIKQTLDRELDKKVMILKQVLRDSVKRSYNTARDDFRKIAPKCTDILVYDPYNKNINPYNPNFPIKTGDFEYFSNEDVIINLQKKIYPIINSFV